jgi:FKBP-type peptidyl-prolyl cis-trans isomerase
MKEGERATFLLPYNFGYGEEASSNVPAYSPIIMDFSIEKLRDEEEQIKSYIADNKYNMITTDTGLRYSITKELPTGAALKSGQTVAVNYTGKLLYFEGILDAKNKLTTTFDSGNFSFVLGTAGSIAGFDQGVSKLKVGEKGIIIMPSSLGYKDTGSGKIPGKSPLFFEIEVVSAQ